MKKNLNIATVLLLSAALFSCKKPAADLTPATENINNSGGNSGGGSGSGSGGSGSGGSGGGTATGVFSAKFNVEVPDIYNIFETTPVKLVSTGTGIKTYRWELGDGRRSTVNNISVVYPYHGYYTVTLTVEDTNGKTDTQTKSFSVLCNFGGGWGGNGSH